MDNDESLKRRFDAWRAISEARSAIAMARQRVESVEELCARLESADSPDELGRVVNALIERGADATNGPVIARALHRISEETEKRPSAERDRLDRSTGRLLRVLDPALATPLAMQWGRHRTKRRRGWAIKALRSAPLTDEIRGYLIDRFDETGDVEFLKLILREPLPLSLDRGKLFDAFDGDDGGYWQARVAEAALKSDPSLAAVLCAERPHAFCWAVGRLGLREHAALIIGALERANDKVPLIGIAIWALGKLGSKTELLALEPLIDELECAYPNPFA